MAGEPGFAGTVGEAGAPQEPPGTPFAQQLGLVFILGGTHTYMGLKGARGAPWGSSPHPMAHRLGIDVQGALEVPWQVTAVGHSSQPQPEPELGTDVPGTLRPTAWVGTRRGGCEGDMEGGGHGTDGEKV